MEKNNLPSGQPPSRPPPLGPLAAAFRSWKQEQEAPRLLTPLANHNAGMQHRDWSERCVSVLRQGMGAWGMFCIQAVMQPGCRTCKVRMMVWPVRECWSKCHCAPWSGQTTPLQPCFGSPAAPRFTPGKEN